jgi:hypothetical protein
VDWLRRNARALALVCGLLLAATAASAFANDADVTTYKQQQPKASAAAAGPRTLYIGDSLGIGTVPELRKLLDGTVTADVAEGRSSTAGIDALRDALKAGKYDRIIIDLGTNDGDASTLSDSLAKAKKLAGDTPLYTFTVNGPAAEAKNKAIAQSGITTIGWAAASKNVTLDSTQHIHPDGAGYAKRAKLVADALDGKTTTSSGGGGADDKTTGTPSSTSGGGDSQTASDPEDSIRGGSTVDHLTQNGLGSPTCKTPAQLPGWARSNCDTSGTIAARAPIDHYGFDIHIDNGVLGVSGSAFLGAFQTLGLELGWQIYLYLLHAVLIALEWAYSLDILKTATAGLQAATKPIFDQVTKPLIGAGLAILGASAFVAALVRRRIEVGVENMVGGVALLAVGLWLLANPTGTIGWVGQQARDASLGVVSLMSTGKADSGEAGLAKGMQSIWGQAVSGPWCYMEFGDVDWCRNPNRLDPRLKEVAAKLAADGAEGWECRDNGACIRRNDDTGKTIVGTSAGPEVEFKEQDDVEDIQQQAATYAKLLRNPGTNMAIFLAFPANGDARNSINKKDSLFRVLCGNDDDNHCKGPTRNQAEFRTESYTWQRAGGLAFILVGGIALLCLLAFVAFRLVAAAIMAVVYLAMAVVAVLLPLFGRAGRKSFVKWGSRLFGATIATFIYSVFLGVIFLVAGTLQTMGTTGFFAQWGLMAAFWWVVFLNREQVLEFARMGNEDMGDRGVRALTALLAARQLTSMAGRATRPARQAAGLAGTGARRGIHNLRAESAARRDQLRAGHQTQMTGARELADRQTGRLVDQQGRDADAASHPREAARLDRKIASREQQLQQIKSGKPGFYPPARSPKEQRKLEARRQRVQAELDELRQRKAAGRPELYDASTDAGRKHRLQQARFLDEQAALPRSQRDWAALAPLAGKSPADYRHQPHYSNAEDKALARTRDRLAIDRALRQRTEANEVLKKGSDARPAHRDRPEPSSAKPSPVQERVNGGWATRSDGQHTTARPTQGAFRPRQRESDRGRVARQFGMQQGDGQHNARRPRPADGRDPSRRRRPERPDLQ